MIPRKSTYAPLYEPAQRARPIDGEPSALRPHAWHGRPVEQRIPLDPPAGTPMIGRTTTRQRLPSEDASGEVLCPADFERFLARERSLADRGTRLFSLMVLRRGDGTRDEGWAKLAPGLRERLRSTDLVGSMDADRVAVLLTDTEPEGARIVAGWVDLFVAELGIRVDPTTYVYPSVNAARPEDKGPRNGPFGGAAGNGRANGHADGRVNGTGNIHALKRMDDGAEKVLSTEAGDPDAGPAASHWAEEDLWTQFSSPLPSWKRALDICASGTALVALLPLFMVVAIAIKLDAPGPVIFRQKRAGRAGRPFDFYKFRSMHVDAEQRRAELEALNEKDGPIFKIHDDPRITRVGRWIRRWSIDELPQLWNIFKGDISLVGPRSPTLNEVAEYERWQQRRLNVTGGITCIWQVSGRSQISFREWMRMDMRYIKRCGLWLDLCLLARTVPAVLTGRGAY